MSKSVFQKMHEQHVQWQQDHEAWLADIDAWKKEFHSALADLADVEAMLRDSLDGLQVHADAVWEDQQRIKAHESTLSEESKAGQNKTDKAWADTHRQMASRHGRATERHARIKQHYHAVVAEIMTLLSKARQAV